MKLLYITNGINGSGGLERVLSVKASYLADNLDYEVHILTLNNGGKNLFYEFNNKIKIHDINVEGNPVKYFLSYKKGIKKTLEAIKPSVISVCDDGLKGMLFPLIFGKKIPVVYERHAAKDFNFSKSEISSYFINVLLNYTSKKFDSFVVLTNGNRKDWPKANCEVIANPLSFKFVANNVKKEKTVLAVGSQSYNKGFDLLIDAWKEVNYKYPDWILKIYGKKNPSLKLKNRVDSLGLNKTVLLFDPVKNIEEEYEKASIFALSSRTEGFGMVLIEAMNFGVPCVSFDCPHGPTDIIKDNDDGILVENENIEKFSQALINLMGNKELRERMGANAKENVKRYSLDNIVPIWDKLFRRLIK